MKACSKEAAKEIVDKTINWIDSYRRSHPHTRVLTYSQAGILERTHDQIFEHHSHCLLSTFCKMLKMYGLGLAYENGENLLVPIGDGTQLPSPLTTYMRIKLNSSNQGEMSFLQSMRQLINTLGIDRTTFHKAIGHHTKNIRSSNNHFRLLVGIWYCIDLHIWIYRLSDNKSLYQII